MTRKWQGADIFFREDDNVLCLSAGTTEVVLDWCLSGKKMIELPTATSNCHGNDLI